MAKKKKVTIYRKSEGVAFADWFRELESLAEGYEVHTDSLDYKLCKECYEEDYLPIDVINEERYRWV